MSCKFCTCKTQGTGIRKSNAGIFQITVKAINQHSIPLPVPFILEVVGRQACERLRAHLSTKAMAIADLMHDAGDHCRAM